MYNRVRVSSGKPQVGTIMAYRGSWDRKYKVLAVSEGSNKNTVNVTVEYIGRFFASLNPGKNYGPRYKNGTCYVAPLRRTVRTVTVSRDVDGSYSEDGQYGLITVEALPTQTLRK